MGSLFTSLMDNLGSTTLALIFMIQFAWFCGFFLSYRFPDGLARVLAIGLAAAAFLPILVPGTLAWGAGGFVALLVLILFLKPRAPDES